MAAILRAGLTQTINAYRDMPERIDDLPRLQGRLDEVREANLAHHRELAAEAAARGVGVLCLGELFAAPYFALHREPMWRALAEDAERGPSVTAMREVARTHGMVVIAPIYELDAERGERFNTAVVIDERGEVLGAYRKNHVPKGSNEQGAFDERFYYAEGDGRQNEGRPGVRGVSPHFPVFETTFGVLGVAICYDRHFEGVVSALARGGAQVVFCPAVTFGAKSERLWDLEFAVDAARHRVYVGGSNREGAERPWNQRYFGKSGFVGPEGPIPDVSDHPNLVIADLDLDALEGPDPSGWDLRGHARPGIYGSP